MAGHIPHGNTARRLQWSFLPPALRRAIEQQCGAPIVEAISCDAGFTPGLASVLIDADGGRHFVKAASVQAQRIFAEAYREEARKLRGLPEGAPAPRLLWTLGVGPDGGPATDGWDDWVVLGIEYVEARPPERPWRQDDVDAVLAMLTATAPHLATAPDVLGLNPVAREFADWPAFWERPALAALPHAAEAAALAAGFAEATAGEAIVHTDIRDDNLLLCDDGRVLLCDWNWPVAGAPWIDSVLLLIGPRGDGLDVEPLLAAHPLTADVPPAHIDAWLALVTGYFLAMAAEAVPPTSPHIRVAQRWQGEVCWSWLAERRGWTSAVVADGVSGAR